MLKEHFFWPKMGGDVHETYKVRANKHRKAITFKAVDLVWLHLTKGRFPSRRKNKLMPRGDGPFKVLEKVNDNAYKVELPRDMGVSPTFNMGDLTPYLEDDDGEDDLRENHIQEGQDEANSMPNSVQQNTQVLLSDQNLHPKRLAPCTDLESQLNGHPKHLGCVILLF